MERISLLKKTLIYGVGTIGSKVLSFLLVPLYSFYIDSEDFGYYDIVVTTISLLVPFLTLQFSDSVFRWLIEESKVEEIKRIISNTFVFLFCNTIFVVVLSVSIYFIDPFRNHWVLFLLLYTSMIYPFLQQIVRGLGYNKLFAFNGIIYTVVFVLLNVVFLVFFNLGFIYLFISSILATIVASLHLILRSRFYQFYTIKFIDIKLMKSMFLYAVPLIPNSVSWWLINYSSKYFVVYYLGLATSGIFAMANRFPIIIVLFSQVFTLAWQEEAIQGGDYKNNKIANYNNSTLKVLFKVQFILVILLTLSSKFLVSKLLSNEYYDSWIYMPFLYLAGAFLAFSSYYGAFYLSAKRTKNIFYTTFISGAITILLIYLSINRYQLFSVCLSILIGYFLLFFVRVLDTRKIVSIKFPVKVFCVYFSLVVISFLILFLQINVLILSYTLLFLIFILIDNKKYLFMLINKLKLYKIGTNI